MPDWLTVLHAAQPHHAHRCGELGGRAAQAADQAAGQGRRQGTALSDRDGDGPGGGGAKEGAAEAELLTMVELEEAAAGSGAVRPAKGNMGKRGRLRRCAWLSGGGMNCGRFGDASGQT
jgi:hypothetical protein